MLILRKKNRKFGPMGYIINFFYKICFFLTKTVILNKNVKSILNLIEIEIFFIIVSIVVKKV